MVGADMAWAVSDSAVSVSSRSASASASVTVSAVSGTAGMAGMAATVGMEAMADTAGMEATEAMARRMRIRLLTTRLPRNASQTSDEFVGTGEQSFKAGQYQTALRDWQHSLVNDPNNGGVILLMSQAMFALGQYGPAANGVQMGMQMLPESEWGNVVKNYTQIYPNIQNYTDQLKALEARSRRQARRAGAAVPAWLSLRLPWLSRAGRSRTRQGAGPAAQGFSDRKSYATFLPRRRVCQRGHTRR